MPNVKSPGSNSTKISTGLTGMIWKNLIISNMDSVIDKYISQFPKEIQSILKQFQKAIREAAPDAVETISYRMPTFDINGKHLVHFAAFKKHIGFFPTPSAIVAFKNELLEYKTSKGTIQFPIDKPIPFNLIRKIVKFRLKETKSN